MAQDDDDPTLPMRLKAAEYASVDQGTACTQSSFKVGKKSFFFCGPQGGRFKAMFKLDASRPEAQALAQDQPTEFEVGSTQWVTARFSPENPMPEEIWSRWLDESYELSLPKKKVAKRAKK